MKKLILAAVMTVSISTLSFAQAIAPPPVDGGAPAPAQEFKLKSQQCDSMKADLCKEQKVIVEIHQVYEYHRSRGHASQANNAYASMKAKFAAYTAKYDKEFVPLKAEVESLKKRMDTAEADIKTAQTTANDALGKANTAQTTADDAKSAAAKAQTTADTGVANAAKAQTKADLANKNALTGIDQGNNAMVWGVGIGLLALILAIFALMRRSASTATATAIAAAPAPDEPETPDPAAPVAAGP